MYLVAMEGFPSLDWTIQSPWTFAGMVLALSVASRIIHSGLRSIKLTYDAGWSRQSYFTNFKRSLTGFQPNGTSTASDYGYTFILGCFELAAYPILIATNAWLVIGAWISLKAVAQWNVWGQDRSVFNLFLIGNGINLLLSATILARFIVVTNQGG